MCEEKSKMADRFDDLLTKMGTGRWNIYYFLAVGSWCLILPMHTLAGSFLSPTVPHECEEESPDLLPDNTTSPECNLYNATADLVIPCTSWIYNDSIYHSTVTSEFDLVCGAGYMRATFQSIYMFGNLVGAILNGVMSDMFGRKKVLTVGTVVFVVSCIVAAWLPTFFTVSAARLITGIAHPVLLQSGYCLALEVCEPRLRAAVGVLICLPWAFGTMIWGGLGYFIRDWRWLQLAIALPSLTFFPSLWFLDESPRWLLVKKRKEELLRILQKAAKWNQVPAPTREEVEHIMEVENKLASPKSTEKVAAETSTGSSESLREKILSSFVLCRTPRIRLITFVMICDFFVASMVYYGLSLSGGNYTDDPFLYMVFTGLMEVPGYTATAPLLTRFGRKRPIISGYLICGLSLLTIIVIPEDLGWLTMTMAMVGKLCITATYQSIYLFGTELYPTEVRLTGLGVAVVSSRFGSVITPYLTEYLRPTYPWLSSFTFGAGSIAAGLLTLVVHDTLGMALPDTVAGLESADIKKFKHSIKNSENKKIRYVKANTSTGAISNPDETGL
ncbi:organic cation transporter protein-like isoform X2 [Oratosquilla oratoria]|uniref:organic cation transporter protein-like isoform X2 n=1 Tax=Oratosquilla oratoria TaxID=337810 RepID=UPI003F760FB6